MITTIAGKLYLCYIKTYTLPTLPDSGFDRAANFYDPLAQLVYGNSLRNSQLYLLPFIPDNCRVLVIGGGSGWLLEQLLHTGKQLDILYLEASPKMLQKAEQKYTQLRHACTCKVDFRLGNEEALLQHEQYDIVITPFLLDLFPPKRLQQLMQKLDKALSENGLWLFADFWPVQHPPAWWQKILIWGMYVFFGAVSGVEAKELPDYAKHFQRLGYGEVASESFYGGFVQAKVFERDE